MRITLNVLTNFIEETLFTKFKLEVSKIEAHRTFARGYEIEAGAAQLHFAVYLKGEQQPFSVLCMYSCKQMERDMKRYGYTRLWLKPNRSTLSDSTIELTK